MEEPRATIDSLRQSIDDVGRLIARVAPLVLDDFQRRAAALICVAELLLDDTEGELIPT